MRHDGQILGSADSGSLAKESAALTAEEQVTLLFEKLGASLNRHLIFLVRDREEAEELTQEVFLRLHDQVRRGASFQNVKAWLFRIAHNLALDHERAGAHTTTVTPETWKALEERRLDPALDPEALALRDERLRMLHTGINRLPALQQYCLHLRAEGFRYREIAEIVGVSESAVCESLRRGVSRLMSEIHK